MTREEFQELTAGRIVYLDGATGSNLVRAGMPAGACPEQWILEHRDVMLSLQKEYVQAGTDILYCPTFTANRVKLREYGLEDRMEEMIGELVAISREAAESGRSDRPRGGEGHDVGRGDGCGEDCGSHPGTGRRVWIAGDLTMTGEQLRPVGTMELEELIDIYKEQIVLMEKAGVDLLVVETMMSLAECRAALIAAKEVSSLPVMITMTFEADGRSLFGTDAETAAVVLESLGACAVGANCSTGPAHMEQVISRMAAVTRIPIIAKPNAGLPFLDGEGNTCYDMDSEEFTEEMEVLVSSGATVLGGCCGTTPAHIGSLRERFGTEAARIVPRRPDGVRYLASERRTVSFGLEKDFLIVGERINPTGKKRLQAGLRKGSLELVGQFAEEQEQCGARILDVNMGMSGIDEKEMMLRAIEEVGGVTSLPLSLDSSYVDVLEAALRHYPGRALVNSVSLETEKFERLLPIVAKYGAMFILLPLSDAGLPGDMEEKRQIIQKIYNRALSLGMRREDIVVDGLVATVGANSHAALDTLETIRYCRERGFATICGLSNISFGMPERSFVNTAFLTLAIREGLTMAIANPSQELLMGCAWATELLLAREGADICYIEYVGQLGERREAARPVSEPQTGTGGAEQARAAAGEVRDSSAEQEKIVGNLCREKLYNAVLKGNRGGIAKLTEEALEEGEEPSELLNEVLLPAINTVGEYFDKGKYFLPQLIGSAEAMKNAIDVLEPLLLTGTSNEDMPVVVIATVEGDIHDIGKNLVALMLKNYGFRVIDLGKDVPKERIIEAAKENNAQIIALSALMTTTMQRMREVIAYAREEGVTAKVMVGGAVITQEYADEIGADGYSGDAADAVKLARRLNLEEAGTASGE